MCVHLKLNLNLIKYNFFVLNSAFIIFAEETVKSESSLMSDSTHSLDNGEEWYTPSDDPKIHISIYFLCYLSTDGPGLEAGANPSSKLLNRIIMIMT